MPIRMKINIDRFDKNWKLLEHREQWSRSFTKGLMDLLYTSHSQASVAVPFAATDIDSVTRNIDVDQPSANADYTRGMGQPLQLGAPGGSSGINIWPTNIGQYGNGIQCVIPGHCMGIVVGADNTAVTPTDRRLSQMIGHGIRPPDGGDVTFDSYAAGEDASQTMDAVGEWCAQGFIPTHTHRIYGVNVKIAKAGAPGNLTVTIRGSDFVQGSGGDTSFNWQNPTSALCPAIVTGTILEAAIPGAAALTNCTFATPVDVIAGRRYFITLNVPGASAGNSVLWRYDTGGATYEHNPGFCSTSTELTYKSISTNSGATYTIVAGSCFIFEEIGRSVGELYYGACNVENLIIANPNASFDIKRFFTNRSGGNITVQESGLMASAKRGAAAASKWNTAAAPFLIARDTFAGVVVADTEILLVTYTPSITV